MEDQNRGCPIVVWWDLGSCGLPSGYDALGVLETIKSAMNGLGFCGSLNVEALTVKGYVSLYLWLSKKSTTATGTRFATELRIGKSHTALKTVIVYIPASTQLDPRQYGFGPLKNRGRGT
ncbi:unnamed protein product [Arabidopsis thaliana]|uniref:NYN domain-containing protein n=1 Tax=Arabidopsis thaliana TaxID=3702 RepID=A0A5S9XKW8_ARATH|nr:unnamed protein product [Arabidopsis thaliana]